jgi:two-component system chemotaxis response regulator CheY
MVITILVVDDDPVLIELYVHMSRFYGHEIVGVARNGGNAIKLFKSLPVKPDVIILDYKMPVKNGLQAMIELRAMGCESSIIFTTADRDIKERAISSGANGFIEKPFELEKLNEKIVAVMGKKIIRANS